MNKNKTTITALLIISIFLISTIGVSAFSLGSFIDNGMSKIGGMFKKSSSTTTTTTTTPQTKLTTGIDVYDKNSAIIDFFIFFLLFLSISFFALSKYIKEGGQPAKGMAIAVGLALTIAAVKAGMGTDFFIPFVKNIFLFIATVLLYLVLIKLTKVPRWLAFILAPLIVFGLFFFVGGKLDSSFGTSILTGITDDGCIDELKKANEMITPKQAEIGELTLKLKNDGVMDQKTNPENMTETALIQVERKITEKFAANHKRDSWYTIGPLSTQTPAEKTMREDFTRFKDLLNDLKDLKEKKKELETKCTDTGTTPGTTTEPGTIPGTTPGTTTSSAEQDTLRDALQVIKKLNEKP